MATIPRCKVAMVNRSGIEKDVPSIGAKIEVVMMFIWLRMANYSRQIRAEMLKARAAVVSVDEQWIGQNMMNGESERVDADQCAGEGKMAASVVDLCTSLRWVCTQNVRCLVTNAGIWVMAGMDYDMVHYTQVWRESSVLFAGYWSFFASCRALHRLTKWLMAFHYRRLLEDCLPLSSRLFRLNETTGMLIGRCWSLATKDDVRELFISQTFENFAHEIGNWSVVHWVFCVGFKDF